MPRLLLIGAGGFAREVVAWVNRSNLRDVAITGVLTDGRPAAMPEDLGIPFMGSVDDYVIQDGDLFLCAIGSPPVKRHMTQGLEKRGAKFASLIHESAVVGHRVNIGGGSIFCPGVVVTSDVTVGRHVLLNVSSSAGHDSKIGDYCTLSGHVDITGFVRLEAGVFIGTHACVAPQLTVGEWSTIGAGAVVVRPVPSHVTVFGNPAKVIRRAPQRAATPSS